MTRNQHPRAIAHRASTAALQALAGIVHLLMAAACGVGCTGQPADDPVVESTWGRHGLSQGRFHKPRAIAIDDQQQLYVVDMTGRIQVFDTGGRFLRSWRTPDIRKGKPTGLSIDRQGRVMVSDTHYHRILFYSPQGELIADQTIGGTAGNGPGQFGFVTDAAQDSEGNYYVAEYGDYDRIQKFSPDGMFLMQWGSHGTAPGQFIRPQGLAIDREDRIWVADACNHRIQVFEVQGEEARLVSTWGRHGADDGSLAYPYNLALDGQGHVYVSEFGNHRVQKFTTDGRWLASWGTGGRRRGELNRPWALVRDKAGRIHVLDTENHRVQTFRL